MLASGAQVVMDADFSAALHNGLEDRAAGGADATPLPRVRTSAAGSDRPSLDAGAAAGGGSSAAAAAAPEAAVASHEVPLDAGSTAASSPAAPPPPPP